MSLRTATQGTDLAQALAEAGGWLGRAGEAAIVAQKLAETVNDIEFPGAVVPRFTNGHFVYYAVAETSVEWRRLAPLVNAAVGATLSDFSGRLAQLDDGDPFEQLLRTTNALVARVEPGPDLATRRRSALALVQMVDGVRQASKVAHASLRTTHTLLRDFDLALLEGDFAAAGLILDQLRLDARLEGINHLFLEVEALAAAGRWRAIWDSGDFRDVARAYRPPRITEALLRATYWSVIDEPAGSSDLEALTELVRDDVLPVWGNLAAARVATAQADVALPLLLAAHASGEAPSVAGLGDTTSWTVRQQRVLRLLEEAGTLSTPAPEPAPEAVLDLDVPSLRRRLMDVVLAQDPAEMARLLRQLRELPSSLLSAVIENEITKKAWEILSREASSVSTTDWLEWAEQLPELDLIQARSWARDAVGGTPVSEVLDRTERVDQFAASLTHAAGVVEATTTAVLPVVLEWLGRDDEWPRGAYRALYLGLLDLLLMSGETGSLVASATTRLAGAVVSLGLESAPYGALCQDLGEWATRAMSISTIDMILDLAETLVLYSCADGGRRADFWSTVVAGLRPHLRRMTPEQINIVTNLDAAMGGGQIAADFVVPAEVPEDSRITFRGRVAVYTLVESVGLRAKEAIELVAPGVRVDSTGDKVGSARLKALARDVDVFAIDWSRAKHAATEYIEANRGSRPITYTTGSGSSSIVRDVLAALRSLQ